MRFEGDRQSWDAPYAARAHNLNLNLRAPARKFGGMSKFSAADVLELPVQDRLQLVEDIWNSIADAPEALELTDEDKRLIDDRLEERRRNPKAGAPWEEVYARITSRRG